MKKTNLVLAALLTLSFAGCKDAVANISDANTSLVTVGKTDITKGKVFNIMKSVNGAASVINNANTIIYNAEVEITEDMKKSAQETLETYKTMYGDTFTEYLASENMSEEDYINKYLIPSLQSEKLPEKYIDTNFKELCESYDTVQATILEFTDQDDCKAAQSALNDGSETAVDAAKNHSSSSSGEPAVYTIDSDSLDSVVRTIVTSASKDDAWAYVEESDGATYALVKVIETDPEQFKEDAIKALKSIDNVSSAAKTYFFQKYNFVIYDKPIYDAIASDYPDCVVQNMAKLTTAE